MSLYRRFLCWLASREIHEVGIRSIHDTAVKEQRAFELGLVQGQLDGHKQMLDEIEKVVLERRGFETLPSDVAVASKRLVH